MNVLLIVASACMTLFLASMTLNASLKVASDMLESHESIISKIER